MAPTTRSEAAKTVSAPQRHFKQARIEARVQARQAQRVAAAGKVVGGRKVEEDAVVVAAAESKVEEEEEPWYVLGTEAAGAPHNPVLVEQVGVVAQEVSALSQEEVVLQFRQLMELYGRPEGSTPLENYSVREAFNEISLLLGPNLSEETPLALRARPGEMEVRFARGAAWCPITPERARLLTLRVMRAIDPDSKYWDAFVTYEPASPGYSPSSPLPEPPSPGYTY